MHQILVTLLKCRFFIPQFYGSDCIKIENSDTLKTMIICYFSVYDAKTNLNCPSGLCLHSDHRYYLGFPIRIPLCKIARNCCRIAWNCAKIARKLQGPKLRASKIDLH